MFTFQCVLKNTQLTNISGLFFHTTMSEAMFESNFHWSFLQSKFYDLEQINFKKIS